MRRISVFLCIFSIMLFCAKYSANAAGVPEIISVDSTTLGKWTYPEGNQWKYHYGSNGYLIFFGTETASSGRPAVWAEHISAIPTYAQVKNQPGFSYNVVAQNSQDERALVLPQSETRKAISCYNYGSCRLDIALTDGEKHLVTVYTAGFGAGKVENRIELLDAGGELAGAAMVQKNGGTYVTVLADSSFSLVLYDAENSAVGYQAVFFDELLAGALSGVSAASKNRNITLRWDRDDAAKTAIYRKDGSYYHRIAETAENIYTDKNLHSGTEYSYKLCKIQGNRISDFRICTAATQAYTKTLLSVLGPDAIETDSIGKTLNIRAALADEAGNAVEQGTVTIYQKNSLGGALYNKELAACDLQPGGIVEYTYTTAVFGTTELILEYAGDDALHLAESSAVVKIIHQSPGWKQAPLLTKISEEIRPGECFNVYGYGITGDVQAAIFPAQEKAAAEPPAGAVKIETLRADASGFGNFVSAVFPADYAPGVYDVWIKNQYGWSNPVRLNAPIGLFLDEYEAAAGFSVKLIGRNLDGVQFGCGKLPAVKLVNENGCYWGTVLDANRVCVTFTVDNVPAGEYTVWVSNGIGETWGGLESGQTLTVLEKAADPLGIGVVWADRFNWDARYSAAEDFGILPDITKDQTSAFQAAIDWIERRGGGVLYIPAGDYVVKRLALGAGVVLQGEGMEKTLLYSHFSAGDALNYIVYLKDSARKSGLVGIDSLGLRLLDAEYIPDHFISLAGSGNGCDNIFISRVGIEYPQETTAGTGNAVSLLGLGKRVLIRGCCFDGYRAVVSSGYVQSYGKIVDNTFYTASGCCALFSEYSVVENNILVNPGVDTGGYDDAQELHGYSIKGNTYFSGNTVVLGLHMNKRGCGEVVMLEAPSAMYAGGDIASAGADYAELLNAEHLIEDGALVIPRPKYGELYLVITGGTGMGQFRKVAQGSGANRIFVDVPWDVVPDETSQYSLGVYYENTTVYNNHAAQCEAGISFYSNCINCAAIENTLSDTAGITNTAFHIPSACRVNANYFIRVEDNHISNVLGISGFNGLSGYAYRADRDTQLFGLEFKNNTVSNSEGPYPAENGTALKTQGAFESSRTCIGIIIENNHYVNFSNGIFINAGIYGAVMKDNIFTGCKTNISVNSADVIYADGNNGGIIGHCGVSFYGKPGYALADGGLYVTPAIQNNMVEPVEAGVIVSVTDRNKCIGVYGQMFALEPDEIKTDIQIFVPVVHRNCTYKLMLWNRTMQPLAAPDSIHIQDTLRLDNNIK